MSADELPPRPDGIAAGAFSAWLAATRRALPAKGAADVPCGACAACCESSYFIHIAPDETETLRAIPKALQFPAPGLPAGHVVLGHDASGHCPMLVDGRCSIYAQRPRTCRAYDCRVFAATGIAPGGAEAAGVTERVRRWRFDFPGERDARDERAVAAAAAFLRRHADAFPRDFLPRAPAQQAALALFVSGVFDGLAPDTPVADIARAVIDAARGLGAPPTTREPR